MGSHHLLKGIPLFALGMAGGALLIMAAAPLPRASNNCSVMKVNPTAVTSYVLKPPAQETPKCTPVIVKQECPTAQETVTEKLDEATPRKRRRHRYRRYWR